MRHFDAWLLRDPYSIFHYYSSGRRWQETVRDLIQDRKICAPPVDLPVSAPSPTNPHADSHGDSHAPPIDPYARSMHPQDDCAFLRKLPAEIRVMIYEYVFGDEAVHLVQLKGKIRHVRCKHRTSSLVQNRRCCPVTPARWRVHDHDNSNNQNPSQTTTTPPPPQPKPWLAGRDNRHGHTDTVLYPHSHGSLPDLLSNSSLALLRTCRAIYAEASPILYSSVLFDVDDLHTFIAFSLTIARPSLLAIRRLTVQWSPIWQPLTGQDPQHTASSIYSLTHNDQLWALFWARVAALRGLEELSLSVDLGRFSFAMGGLVGGRRLSLGIEEGWVAPLLGVRGLREFELGVTARCDVSARRVVEEGLRRDAVALRDALRRVMCGDRGETEIKSCAGVEARPRLALTAA